MGKRKATSPLSQLPQQVHQALAPVWHPLRVGEPLRPRDTPELRLLDKVHTAIAKAEDLESKRRSLNTEEVLELSEDDLAVLHALTKADQQAERLLKPQRKGGEATAKKAKQETLKRAELIKAEWLRLEHMSEHDRAAQIAENLKDTCGGISARTVRGYVNKLKLRSAKNKGSSQNTREP